MAKGMNIERKINVIIDCDPGVDDCAAIALSFYDEVMNIRLITTVCGNLGLDVVTRNMLHLATLFKRKDIPIAAGADKAMFRVSPDASFIHQSTGMGGYIPPKTVKHKVIEQDAVEAMYETIKKYKNDIVIIGLGPHTNIATLIKLHPDVVSMVNRIYTEGCNPYSSNKTTRWSQYISFNASSDPEAVQIVLESGIPITYVNSSMGRELANFTEEEVYSMAEINDVGKFLCAMYSGYWEHNYPDRRVATNDTCAVLSLRFPQLFKTRKVKFEINTTDEPGKTTIIPYKKGNVDFVYKVNKRRMHEYFFRAIKKLDFIKIKGIDKQLTHKQKVW